MKVESIFRPLLFFVLPVLLLVIMATSVKALGRPENTGKPDNVGTPAATEKLRICQAKESLIKKRTDHLVSLATNIEDKFNSHAKQVEDYYTSKVVPSGKTVKNYDSLVADIQTKKTAIQTDLTKAQKDSDAFSCSGTSPKGQLTKFREDMQVVKKDLKDYRTSIKNLIVAVHSVTGAENRERLVSPKPSSP